MQKTLIDKVVLICDDSKICLKAMQRRLTLDYHVIMASSGYEAVSFATLYQPDCIVMDISMYGMDGIAAAKKIKSSQLTRDIPIIFVTGHDRAEYKEQAVDVGADDFFLKPINIENLINAIERCICESRSTEHSK